MSSAAPLILKRAGATLLALLLVGALVQAPLFRLGHGGPDAPRSSLAALTAQWLGMPAERIGYDASAFFTVRKLATAAVFSLVAAIVWGVVRRDAGHLMGIPSLTPQAVGIIRVVFGASLFWAFTWAGPSDPGFPQALHRHAGPLADWRWIHALAEHGRVAIWIHSGMLGAAAVFAIGFCTRAASVAVAALTTLHTLVLLQRQSAHDWGLPVVTLWLMTLVPWGDALSLDAAWRRYRGRPAPTRASGEYGLAVWIPGLTLGAAFLAAAFAKLDSSGFAWITSGAVRYHFVIDANKAPVDWGLGIAASPFRSQVASFGAVATEGLLILNVFASGWKTRLAFGLAGAALLTGFLLFQGVFWPMWWVLLLFFLPWPQIASFLIRSTAPRVILPSGSSPVPALRLWQVLILGAFALQQVVFSGLRLEMEPFVSDYGMYSFTYRSTSEFDDYLADKRRTLRLEASGDPTIDIMERISDLPGAGDVLTFAVQELRRVKQLSPGTREALRTVMETYEQRYVAPMPTLHVRAEEPRFDWAQGRFAPARQIDYGLLDFLSIAAR